MFDRYVVVDWSARNAPATGADSIWIADLALDGPAVLSNPATRAGALRELIDTIEDSAHQRLLIGVDGSLGYPVGSAALFGLVGVPWQAMWQMVAELSSDDARNRNNRFEVASELNRRANSGPGPFWGCPPRHVGEHLAATKPPGFEVDEFRHAERRLRAQGLHPASCWQLLGAGSVGGQTLTLLPIIAELADRSADRVDVWPFADGLTVPNVDPGGVVVVEVWPTLFVDPDRLDRTLVKDAAQVRSVATALRDADRCGDLEAWFRPELSGPEVADVVSEEGWVLGVVGEAHVR